MKEKALIAALVGGLVFAIILAGFDYFEDIPLSLTKLGANFGIFGCFIGLYFFFLMKKKEKQKGEQ